MHKVRQVVRLDDGAMCGCILGVGVERSTVGTHTHKVCPNWPGTNQTAAATVLSHSVPGFLVFAFEFWQGQRSKTVGEKRYEIFRRTSCKDDADIHTDVVFGRR